jgi:hypothetical protein
VEFKGAARDIDGAFAGPLLVKNFLNNIEMAIEVGNGG